MKYQNMCVELNRLVNACFTQNISQFRGDAVSSFITAVELLSLSVKY